MLPRLLAAQPATLSLLPRYYYDINAVAGALKVIHDNVIHTFRPKPFFSMLGTINLALSFALGLCP